MKGLPRFALFLLLASRLIAADTAFDRFVDEFAAEWIRADPQAATTLQYFTGLEQDRLDRQLTAITPAARAVRIATAHRGLAKLKQWDLATLDATQRLSAATLAWQLDDIIRQDAFADYGFVFQQYSGLQVQLVSFLTQTHPLRNRRDLENYLARLDLVAGQIDEGIVQARERGARGILPPRFILEATIQQLERFCSPPPRQNVLVVSLGERAATLTDLSASERARFLDRAEHAVSRSVIPAFQRAHALLRQQRPQATDDAGLWRLPHGALAYPEALRHHTTTDLTAAEIHELGLHEVARIEHRMDELLRELGYREGNVQERMETLEASLQPPHEADPRPELLARYEAILRDAQERSNSLFEMVPRAPVVVKREPAFTEKNAAAHYSSPAPDGSRPGVFWVPLPGPAFKICERRTLVYHEAVPGHHFQIALQHELPDLPRFRRERVFGPIAAHGEGWALYAEQLAAESGWYAGDVQGQLGQLSAELFRARRLVVDTGLHAMRWTRQQAIEYGISAHEVDRYVVTPGQACAYKIGQLKILDLRAKAQGALGDKFSLRSFHSVILRAGTVPLSVLAQAVDSYVRSQ